MKRRQILVGACGALPLMGRGHERAFRLGITDWNLRQIASTRALTLAKELGFPGLQVSFGRELVNGKLPLDDSDVIREYRQLSKRLQVTIDGTCVDRLHDNGLKSDPLATRWVSDGIRLTKALGTRVLLLPFFGKWALSSRDEMDRVGDALRELAPDAEKAGVILGLETTVSAEDDVRMADRARSPNVLVYYDVGNSTKAGFDPVREIRWLGRARICQVHLKDNPHLLGEGTIRFRPIVEALRSIGYAGWANLETDVDKGRETIDLPRNLSYLREMMEQVYRA